MRPPRFWQTGGFFGTALAPLGAVHAAATARRMAQPGWRAPVPVICCGNATVGGAGKTTLALDLGARLRARGVAVAFLTRGYGGRARGVLRVHPALHDAALVGDEALLLAAVAPCYVAADRAASAQAAVADRAQALIMDDGLQNPSLTKDFSVLVVDGESGFGNGRVIPAGPLREPIAVAASRCRAAVLVGLDRNAATTALPPGLPMLRADLIPDAAVPESQALAFAGIGRPDKFFAMLAAAGVAVVARRPYPDHHRYSEAELRALLAEAEHLGVPAMTTPKDAARLAPADRARVRVVGVRLRWQDEGEVEALLTAALAERPWA